MTTYISLMLHWQQTTMLLLKALLPQHHVNALMKSINLHFLCLIDSISSINCILSCHFSCLSQNKSVKLRKKKLCESTTNRLFVIGLCTYSFPGIQIYKVDRLFESLCIHVCSANHYVFKYL